MRTERTEKLSRGRRIMAHVFALLIALDLALVLFMWLHGPLQIEASKVPFGHRLPNPVSLVPGLVIIWCALAWPGWRNWLGLRPDHVLRLRGVALRAWLVMPLSVALLVAQVRDLPQHAIDVTTKVRKSARKGPAGMSISSSNKHVAPLVRRLVQRERSDPVVVWIQDRDRRGHIAAFYLYPRLMLMEPRLRRYTLRRSMARRGSADPYFFVGISPPMSRSREFAKERGAEFIFAGRNGEREPKQ